MRRLISCYFCPPGAPRDWETFARRLQLSARRHNPAWSIEVFEVSTEGRRGGAEGYYRANTHKLEAWVAAACAAPDGDEIALLDADTMVLGPLDEVWAAHFDVAITMRAVSRRFPHVFPFNAGVVFLRVSPAIRAFMWAWAAENARMLEDRQHHRRFQPRYGGINQSALGFLRESGAMDALAVLEIPCQRWNCEDSTWERFDAQTRILHIKGDLRRTALGIGRGSTVCRPLAALWQSLEAAP